MTMKLVKIELWTTNVIKKAVKCPQQMYIFFSFQIVKSHIIRGTDVLVEDLGNYTRYSSEEGGNIFVVKTDHKGIGLGQPFIIFIFIALTCMCLSVCKNVKGIRKVSQNVVPLHAGFYEYFVNTCVTTGIPFDKISVSLNCCITGLLHSINKNSGLNCVVSAFQMALK